jgi:hypothetical protein
MLLQFWTIVPANITGISEIKIRFKVKLRITKPVNNLSAWLIEVYTDYNNRRFDWNSIVFQV